jgi:hypothetical protein
MAGSISHKRRFVKVVLLWRAINYGIYITCIAVELFAIQVTGMPIIRNVYGIGAN